MLGVIHAYSDGLLQALKANPQSVSNMCEAFIKFEHSKDIYTSYCGQHPDVLAEIQKLMLVIARILKDHPIPTVLSFERYMSLPVERYFVYRQYLGQLSLITQHDPQHEMVAVALTCMENLSDSVDDIINVSYPYLIA